ncbi:MAG TPA: DEAD/DEAH box helicase [Egibacteraceae bacterium]|nr:DEAD/DEAH box helicase [Egibacteraceae bacterium]
MTVLHALWSDGRLHVWGERPLAGDVLPRPRGRRPAPGRARRHPYAASADELVAALAEIGVSGPGAGELRLRLPSTDASPLPSPGLPGASVVDRRAGTSLAPWRVDALAVPPAPALELLLSTPTDDPSDGRSLVWLAAAARLALNLVARGRVLPALVVAPGGHEARWLPVLAADDRDRIARLAAGMPPVLRAEDRPEPADAGALTREVLTALVDATARDALRRDGGIRLPRSRRTASSPAAESWLTALTLEDARVEADATDLALLAKQLDAWRRSSLVDTGPLRTCFRLHSPPPKGDAEHDDAGWRLEFCLQATDDPSLVVPAAEVWQARDTLRFLERRFEQPQERLLADLGRASRLYPELERALHVARPDTLDLDGDEVLWFLADGMALLEQAGFGVLVPAELRRPARLGVRLRASTKKEPATASSGLLSTDRLAEYSWEVAVGDATLSEAELRELARLKAPLVRVRGQWVSLARDDLAKAVRLLERQRTHGARTADVGEVVRLGLGLVGNDTGLPVVGADGDGALGALLSGRPDERLEPMATPAGFNGSLRAYQERGLAWLAFLGRLGLGACLADDMGLGKTPQLLALLAAERDGRSRRSRAWPGPTLLVCPTSVVGNWEREAAKFTPALRVLVHHGATRLRDQKFTTQARRSDLVLTSYPLATRDHRLLAQVPWGRVALDEAQNIKNRAAKQTRVIRSLPARQRVALTGTPVENRLAELWSIMDFLNPGFLGPAKAFRERFAIPIERYGDDTAAAQLKRLTGPFVLRRTKTDKAIVPDLPDKLETTEHCLLTREQASLYQATVDDLLARIDEEDGMARKGLVLQTMLRLKQVCNHPAQLLGDGSPLPGRSGKLTRLDELVDEILDAGEKALVFTQFAGMGAMLVAHLRARLGRDVAFLHGGTPKRTRDTLVTAFQSETGPPLFVLSLKAGGVGLNLTAANHVIHFDRWWNPAVENQATDRAFRIGQRRDVLVRKLMCTGTLEERIDEMITRKKALADQVVGSGEAWLTELSTDELRQVVALSAEAVA